jgi:hypothetical protein
MAEPSKIMTCSCQHAGQDELYGKGLRLWNRLGESDSYRCTVCGNTNKGAVGKKK